MMNSILNSFIYLYAADRVLYSTAHSPDVGVKQLQLSIRRPQQAFSKLHLQVKSCGLARMTVKTPKCLHS